jgi:hypothetical protein
VILACLAYVIIGVVTAALAGSAASPAGTTSWRLAGWGLSLAVFIVHLVASRRRGSGSLGGAAARVALAVAVGALVLAVAGPVRSHWGEPEIARVAALSIVLWPLLTGLPAFVAALAGGYLIDRFARPTSSAQSR